MRSICSWKKDEKNKYICFLASFFHESAPLVLPAIISNPGGASGPAGGYAAKVRKNDKADSEFCEGRQKNFAKEGNDSIFS